MKLKKFVAGGLVAALVFAVADPVAAAQNKGVVVPVVYTGNEATTTGITFWGDDLTEFPTGDYTITEDIYIPTVALPESSGDNLYYYQFSVWSYFDEYNPAGEAVRSFDRVSDGFFVDRPEGKDPQVSPIDENAAEAIKNVSIKTQGDYYIVQLKDYPLDPSFIQYDDAGNDSEYTDDLSVEDGTRIGNGIVVSIASNTIEYNGLFAVNNASYAIDGKKIKDIPFDIPADSEDAIIGNYWGTPGNEGFYGTSFDDEYILKVGADEVKVKKGKSKKIDLVTMSEGMMPEASIDNAKVAKVSIKNGKLVVKGKKKGTAIVTVSLNGVSKEFAVRVK